ncbi:hypothetical protein T484DRAFT_1819000, partial [Baffinella frigidus]
VILGGLNCSNQTVETVVVVHASECDCSMGNSTMDGNETDPDYNGTDTNGTDSNGTILNGTDSNGTGWGTDADGNECMCDGNATWTNASSITTTANVTTCSNFTNLTYYGIFGGASRVVNATLVSPRQLDCLAPNWDEVGPAESVFFYVLKDGELLRSRAPAGLTNFSFYSSWSGVEPRVADVASDVTLTVTGTGFNDVDPAVITTLTLTSVLDAADSADSVCVVVDPQPQTLNPEL